MPMRSKGISSKAFKIIEIDFFNFSIMDGFSIGCRVRDVVDGTRGTVKYIGPVAAAKNKTEMWLGAEGGANFVKILHFDLKHLLS
jgi:hypothetical protein